MAARQELAGQQRKLQDENFKIRAYFQGYQVKEHEMGGEYTSTQRKRCKILIRKVEGMVFLGRPIIHERMILK
jgi:hypothetical protein